jgi:hypothetical protein
LADKIERKRSDVDGQVVDPLRMLQEFALGRDTTKTKMAASNKNPKPNI